MAGDLYIYRYWHPGYGQWQTLDCFAPDRAAALVSAIKFTRREHRRLQKATQGRCGIQIPRHEAWMKRASEAQAQVDLAAESAAA